MIEWLAVRNVDERVHDRFHEFEAMRDDRAAVPVHEGVASVEP
jgi:hypothetical protein